MKREAEACKPVLRPAVAADLRELALLMRHEDIMEVFHASGRGPYDALERGFLASRETLTVTLEGRVVLMVGIVGVPGQYGVPWMLASYELGRIRKSFLRQGTALQMRWLAEYKYLENRVWVENKSHIQWLQWLGFSFDAPEVFGVGGEVFQRFFMKE